MKNCEENYSLIILALIGGILNFLNVTEAEALYLQSRPILLHISATKQTYSELILPILLTTLFSCWAAKYTINFVYKVVTNAEPILKPTWVCDN